MLKGGCKGKKGAKPAGEREVFENERIKGYISQWISTWGWIVPSQRIANPEADRLNKSPNPRLYCHANDTRDGTQLSEGCEITFFLYKDDRGLGATDIGIDEGDEAEGLEQAAEGEGAEEGAEDAAMEDGGEEATEGGEEAEEPADETGADWPPGLATPSSALAGRMPKAGGLAKAAAKMSAAPPKASVGLPKAGLAVAAQNPKAKAAAQAPKAKAAVVAPAPKAQQPAAAAAPTLPSFASKASRKTQRFRGKVAKWSQVFGWITPSATLPDDLQPTLQRFNNGIYVNWRSLQQDIAMEVGLAVDFLIESDENGLMAMDVGTTGKAGTKPDRFAEVQKALGGSIGSLKAELERASWQSAETKTKLSDFKAQAEEKEEAAAEEEYAAQAEAMEQETEQDQGYAEEEPAYAEEAQEEAPAAADESELPPGWTQIWSEDYQCYYFWHKASKTPSWDRPTGPPAQKVAPKAKAPATPTPGKADSKGKKQEQPAAKGKGQEGKKGKGKFNVLFNESEQAQEEEQQEEQEEQQEEEEAPPAPTGKGVKRKGGPVAAQAAKAPTPTTPGLKGGKKQKSK